MWKKDNHFIGEWRASKVRQTFEVAERIKPNEKKKQKKDSESPTQTTLTFTIYDENSMVN